VIIGVWAVVFYFNMLEEVYDSLDDGLDNYKLLIIEKTQKDSTVLYKTAFEESNYSIKEIPKEVAVQVKDIYKDTLMYMINEEDFEPVRMLTTAFEQEGNYYQLKVISSMVEEDDLISDLLSAIILLYLAMLISILIFNNLLLKRIWKPFYHLIDQLKLFRLGNDTMIQSRRSSVEEFQLLNQTVESLIKRSLDTYNSQREFIENASHELQTPLAISINKLELLAERNSLSADDMTAVGSVIQTLERLTRLNKSLLLLSKIENRQFQNDTLVSINDVVKTTVTEFEDFAAFKTVTVALQEKGILHRNMNADLAQILVANLVKNAIVHNHAGGSVEIRITSNELTVTNTGNERELNGDRIFERFHKETKEGHSTGLGLAIVKAITQLYNIDVMYSYHEAHVIKIHFN
jgi:signal transduction histidine kinase